MSHVKISPCRSYLQQTIGCILLLLLFHRRQPWSLSLSMNEDGKQEEKRHATSSRSSSRSDGGNGTTGRTTRVRGSREGQTLQLHTLDIFPHWWWWWIIDLKESRQTNAHLPNPNQKINDKAAAEPPATTIIILSSNNALVPACLLQLIWNSSSNPNPNGIWLA